MNWNAETLPSSCKLYFAITDSAGTTRGSVEFWPGKPLGEQFSAELCGPKGTRTLNYNPRTRSGLFPSLQTATEVILRTTW